MIENVRIGIDPGDRYCGIAALYRVKKTWYAEATLFDAQESEHWIYDPPRALASLLTKPLRTSPAIAIERYAVRPVGHQSFTGSNALRQIGALDYVARTQLIVEPTFIPAGDASDLRSLDLTWFHRWRQMWRGPALSGKSTPWEHCVSAWRVLAFALADEDGDFLARVRRLRLHSADYARPHLIFNSRARVAPLAKLIVKKGAI